MTRRLSILMVLVCCSVLAARPSSAHTWTDYYGTRWKAANGGTVWQYWRFINNVPAGGFRDRVVQGAEQWNAQNQPMYFVLQSQDYGDWQSPCAAPLFRNAVRFAAYDGGGPSTAAAVTGVCRRSWDGGATYQLTNFLITFDNAENWNTTTGDTPDGGILGTCDFLSTCGVDLWGIAAHEFGHATGFGSPPVPQDRQHWSPSEDACTPSDALDYHTMCPTYDPGSDRERTLEIHDYHTFNTAY